MNESYEVELNNIKASFLPSEFDLIVGVENTSTLAVKGLTLGGDFTDIEWQVVYCRVLVDERWYFLPHNLYDEIEDVYGDQIGNRLWELSQTL
jgi:hypothetical protein